MRTNIAWKCCFRLRTTTVLLLACLAAPKGLFAQSHAYPSGGGLGGASVPPAPPPYAIGRPVPPLEAIRQTAYLLRIDSLRRLTSRTVRGAFGIRPSLVFAGPDLRISDLSAYYTVAPIKHMNLGPNGEDAEGIFQETLIDMGWEAGDRITGGLELLHSRTFVRGRYGWETQTFGGDAFLTLKIGRHLRLGAFGSAEQVDVEYVNDNGFRYTGGAVLGGRIDVGKTTLGASAVLAATFEDVTRREYDTLVCSLLDAETQWSERITTSLFLFGSDSIRQDMPGDRSFWTAGGEVRYMLNERWTVTLGYEKTLAVKDYREDRVFIGATMNW